MVKGSRLWIGHSSLVCKWPLAGFGPIQEVARQQLVSTCCTESLALIHKRWKHQGGKAACHQHWKSTLPGHTSKNHCHRQPRRPHLHCSKLYQSSKCKNWHIPCQGRSTCGFCESHLKLLGESMWVDQMASGLEEVGVGYQNAPWSQQSWGPSHRLTICNGHHHTSWEFYAFFPGPNMLGAAEIWRSNQNSAESTGAWASCHLENQLQLLLPKQLPLKPVICEVKDVAKKECWPKNQGPVPTPENMRIAQAWHCWPHTPLAEHIAMACTRLECQKLHIWSFWLSCSWQHA